MASKALADVAVRHQTSLEGLKSGESKRFTAFLRRIDKSLKKKLAGDDLTEFSRTRIEKQLSGIDSLLKGEFDAYREQLAVDLEEIGQYEAEFEKKTLENLGKQDGEKLFEMTLPAESQIKAAIFSQPLSIRGVYGGELLNDFVKDWTASERRRVIGAIRQGAFEGQTNAQIIRTIRGTKANNYSDGILAISARNADAIVRTSVQHVSSVARAATWEANADIVNGYRIVATLDGRTSAICRSMDDKTFKHGKGPKPPFHIRCRTTTIAELSDEFAFLSKGRTRASMDGPVKDQSYYDWLMGQPKEFQDDVLGPKRGKLFRDGGLTVKKFAELNLGKSFKPLTLAEMRKKEPQAFLKTFSGDDIKLTQKAETAKVKESRQQQAITDWIGKQSYQKRLGNIDNLRIKKLAEEYGLNQAEQVAVREYTDVGYISLNNVLRGIRKDDSGIIINAAEVLREALKKMPDYAGQVVRRDKLPDSFLAEHTVGKIVEYRAFTSSTYGVSDVFNDKPHRLVILSKTGKKIDWISEYGKQEQEVLFNSPTKFKVMSRRTLKDGTIEIRMKEVTK